MKRFFSAVLLIFIFFSLPLAAENLQIVMPKIIYTGDTVEIRYIFKTPEFLFTDENKLKPGEIIHLKKDSDFLKFYEDDFAVTDGFLQILGSDCTLTLSVISWKPGYLELPRFSLGTFLENCWFDSAQQQSAQLPAFSAQSARRFFIEISPVEVKSLAAKTGKKDFLPAQSPLVLPGTTALLVTLGILAFILFAVLVFILLHIPEVSRFVTNLLYLYSLKKNTRKTIKKLSLLLKNSQNIPEDKNFAGNLEHILREFLTARFKKDFSSVTTERIYGILEDTCGGEFSAHQGETVENLVSLFSRLDFIRFAPNAEFTGGEQEKLTETAILTVEAFEKEEE